MKSLFVIFALLFMFSCGDDEKSSSSGEGIFDFFGYEKYRYKAVSYQTERNGKNNYISSYMFSGDCFVYLNRADRKVVVRGSCSHAAGKLERGKRMTYDGVSFFYDSNESLVSSDGSVRVEYFDLSGNVTTRQLSASDSLRQMGFEVRDLRSYADIVFDDDSISFVFAERFFASDGNDVVDIDIVDASVVLCERL